MHYSPQSSLIAINPPVFLYRLNFVIEHNHELLPRRNLGSILTCLLLHHALHHLLEPRNECFYLPDLYPPHLSLEITFILSLDLIDPDAEL